MQSTQHPTFTRLPITPTASARSQSEGSSPIAVPDISSFMHDHNEAADTHMVLYGSDILVPGPYHTAEVNNPNPATS